MRWHGSGRVAPQCRRVVPVGYGEPVCTAAAAGAFVSSGDDANTGGVVDSDQRFGFKNEDLTDRPDALNIQRCKSRSKHPSVGQVGGTAGQVFSDIEMETPQARPMFTSKTIPELNKRADGAMTLLCRVSPP